MNAPTLPRHLEPAGSELPAASSTIEATKDTTQETMPAASRVVPDLAELVERLLGADGLDIRDRQHHLRRYRACFIGAELIAFLAKSLAITRESALELAQRLEAGGYIKHVVGGHPIKDEHLFYRLSRVISEPVKAGELDRQQLAEIVQAMRDPSGLPFGVRYRWFVRYSDCFAGHEAVTWISAYCGVSREQAVLIGQSLLRANYIRHLFDEHSFSDSALLFRFL
ncbi:MAG: hypothetical protein AB8C46_22640 [Burkholderiaceae bacterium]